MFDADPPAIFADGDAARLSEIEIAGQLAQDQQVDAVDDFGLERRGVEQLGVKHDRAKIRVERKGFSQPEQTVAGAFGGRTLFVFGHAGAAEQDCIGVAGDFQRCRRKRVAGLVQARAADRCFLKLQGEVAADSRSQDFHRLRGDFPADSVAGENRDLHAHDLEMHPRPSGGLRSAVL